MKHYEANEASKYRKGFDPADPPLSDTVCVFVRKFPPVQHSPLPWTIGKNANGALCLWTTTPARNIIAKFYPVPHEPESDPGNIMLVLEACNNYERVTLECDNAIDSSEALRIQRDELLAALKHLVNEERNGTWTEGSKPSQQAWAQAEAAIANAEGRKAK